MCEPVTGTITMASVWAAMAGTAGTAASAATFGGLSSAAVASGGAVALTAGTTATAGLLGAGGALSATSVIGLASSVIGFGFQAFSTIQGNKAVEAQAEFQQAELNRQTAARNRTRLRLIEDAAVRQKITSDEGSQAQGQANVDAAARGVLTGQGSEADVQKEIQIVTSERNARDRLDLNRQLVELGFDDESASIESGFVARDAASKKFSNKLNLGAAGAQSVASFTKAGSFTSSPNRRFAFS
jgi:hypothetical protein